MDNEFNLQEKEKPGEREDIERRKREREDWERETGGGSAAPALAPSTGTRTGAAKEYGQTVVDAASKAREYITDKASAVGDKLQGLSDMDYQQYANQAKDNTREHPGQALLVAAAAGFIIGLLVRGGRR